VVSLPSRRRDRLREFRRECMQDLRQVVWPRFRPIQRGVRVATGTALIVTTLVGGLNVGFEHGIASLIH
jgi:preprotein translocase subunit SecE